MQKPKEKKPKVFRSKVLYKKFNLTDGRLTGPFSAKMLRDANGKYVYLSKVKPGVYSARVRRKLKMCNVGYHAVSPGRGPFMNWLRPTFWTVLFKVQLFNCFYSDGKWVGTHFRFLKRVSYADWQRMYYAAIGKRTRERARGKRRAK